MLGLIKRSDPRDKRANAATRILNLRKAMPQMIMEVGKLIFRIIAFVDLRKAQDKVRKMTKSTSVLTTPNCSEFASVRQLLNEAQSIAVVAGAGISTSCGIPVFFLYLTPRPLEALLRAFTTLMENMYLIMCKYMDLTRALLQNISK